MLVVERDVVGGLKGETNLCDALGVLPLLAPDTRGTHLLRSSSLRQFPLSSPLHRHLFAHRGMEAKSNRLTPAMSVQPWHTSLPIW